MESITIKVEDHLAKEIDNVMIPYYSTKTEFIREAIRDKIKQLKQEHLLSELASQFGKVKNKTSVAQEREIRELVSKQLLEKYHSLK